LSAAAVVILNAIFKRKIKATLLIYFLYQLLQIVLSPVVALYLLYRGLRDRRYFARLGERLGLLPQSVQSTGSGAIWFHAVSVGEVLSAMEMLRQLRRERPSVHLFVSTTTLAGRATAVEKLGGIADAVFFVPLDYRSCVRRVLRRLRPSLVVVLETEIWPNLYRETKRAGASLLVVNGRISDRALPRYQRWNWFFRHALRWPDRILTQTQEDVRRYQIAGAPADILHAAGNIKYDFTPATQGIAPALEAFLEQVASRKIWIAASTMPPATAGDIDEDDAVIAAFQQLPASTFLILVPRKPERFDVVAEKLERAGLAYVRRSKVAGTVNPATRVLLLDTIGELAPLFAHADVVFMGGTLAERGGHNILEPAYFAKPIIVGPHMENFAAIAAEFQQADAVQRIAAPSELSAAVAELLDDPHAAARLGTRARELAQSKRGVTRKIIAEIWAAYDEGVPDPPRRLSANTLLTPLSWLWRAGHRINVTHSAATRRSLKTPVISVGGIAMGGVGKSPMVAHLATRMREAGREPAILTRGYKRRSPESLVIVTRGQNANVELTGDEAQMFIRTGDAHVGIGSNRYEVALEMESRLQPGVFLLDDGFQHMKLERQHDVVLIDALDPFAGGVFPLGRSREPASGLSRATAIVVTRGHDAAGLDRKLRRYTQAPIFRSRVIPREWVDVHSTMSVPLAEPGFRKVAAFCGLGNPRSFWSTLDDLGLEVVYRWAFNDHQCYRPMHLKRIVAQAKAAGAEAIVTTEKDSVNLCEDSTVLSAPLRLYWLKIGIEIEREEELLRLIV
jgi:3-deoxy-D-manno-octulosonic-acid transferase